VTNPTITIAVLVFGFSDQLKLDKTGADTAHATLQSGGTVYQEWDVTDLKRSHDALELKGNSGGNTFSAVLSPPGSNPGVTLTTTLTVNTLLSLTDWAALRVWIEEFPV
jgi:hypothetical protein